jgi:hypothetical protein
MITVTFDRIASDVASAGELTTAVISYSAGSD